MKEPHDCRDASRRTKDPWRTSALIAGLFMLVSMQAVWASVTLSDFRVEERADGSARITWVTATELNTIAFQLFRAEASSGPWGDPIDQQGAKGDGVTGGTYTYDDTGVAAGHHYYYLLKEIASDSTGGTHGPIEISIGMTPTATATATATATEDPAVTSTATRTPTRTLTPTHAPTTEGQVFATATRQFTNTPRPTATSLPLSATPLPGAPAATELPAITPVLSTPTAAPGAVAIIPPTIPPTQAALRAVAATSTPVPTPTTVPATLAATVEHVTLTPAVFSPATSSVLPARVNGLRPTATPPVASSGRSTETRTMMWIGGGAIASAMLLFGAVALIRRPRKLQ